jgi:large subunit ribosomal protein L35
MPKLKTHSGAKKRFKKTASGKIKYKKPGKRHLLAPSSSKPIRKARRPQTLNATDSETILRRYLPNH